MNRNLNPGGWGAQNGGTRPNQAMAAPATPAQREEIPDLMDFSPDQEQCSQQLQEPLTPIPAGLSTTNPANPPPTQTPIPTNPTPKTPKSGPSPTAAVNYGKPVPPEETSEARNGSYVGLDRQFELEGRPGLEASRYAKPPEKNLSQSRTRHPTKETNEAGFKQNKTKFGEKAKGNGIRVGEGVGGGQTTKGSATVGDIYDNAGGYEELLRGGGGQNVKEDISVGKHWNNNGLDDYSDLLGGGAGAGGGSVNEPKPTDSMNNNGKNDTGGSRGSGGGPGELRLAGPLPEEREWRRNQDWQLKQGEAREQAHKPNTNQIIREPTLPPTGPRTNNPNNSGYQDQERLNLARQLQAEFSGGRPYGDRVKGGRGNNSSGPSRGSASHQGRGNLNPYARTGSAGRGYESNDARNFSRDNDHHGLGSGLRSFSHGGYTVREPTDSAGSRTVDCGGYTVREPGSADSRTVDRGGYNVHEPRGFGASDRGRDRVRGAISGNSHSLHRPYQNENEKDHGTNVRAGARQDRENRENQRNGASAGGSGNGKGGNGRGNGGGGADEDVDMDRDNKCSSWW